MNAQGFIKTIRMGSYRKPIPFKKYLNFRKLVFSAHKRAEDLYNNINWE